MELSVDELQGITNALVADLIKYVDFININNML